MFRFEDPKFLYLLVIIPALVVLFIWGNIKQKRRLKEFGDPNLLKTLMPNVSYSRPKFKFYIILAALTLMIFSLARPQFGLKRETKKSQGIEAMVLLDVSKSMLAADVKPNRLEYSKMMLSKLFDKMQDDKVGLIVFAGDAFIQLPITSDNVSAKMFLSSINTNMVPQPGTAIGTAIDLATRSFGDNDDNDKIGKTIILFTDGENHEDDAVAAAKLAVEKGMTVNVVGLGSPAGEPIPIPGTSSYLKDKDGNVVVTKLDEQMCNEIADAGKGVYVRADNSDNALRVIEKQIDHMQKGDLKADAYSTYDEKFYALAWLALVFLVVEFFILNRKNKKLSKIKWF